MDEKPTMEALLYAARRSREEMGPDADWAPIVVYTGKNGQEALGLLGSDEPVPEQLVSALIEMHRVMGPAAWITFTSDSYATRVSPEEMAKGVTDPEAMADVLASEFKKGSPDVIEMMITMLVTHDGHAKSAYQQYRYTPVDGWEWEEPGYSDSQNPDAGHGGNVENALMAFFVAQRIAGQ